MSATRPILADKLFDRVIRETLKPVMSRKSASKEFEETGDYFQPVVGMSYDTAEKLKQIVPDLEFWKGKLGYHVDTLIDMGRVKTAYDLVMDLSQPGAQSGDALNYVCYAPNDDPIGFVSFWMGATCVNEIIVVGFKPNQITLVKDVISEIKRLLGTGEYHWIEWSVTNTNPIKKAYDKIADRWGAETYDEGDYTHYILQKDKQKYIS